MKNGIKAITDKKISLVTINIGTNKETAALGSIMNISQNDYSAGEEAGHHTKLAGVKSFVCVNHPGLIAARALPMRLALII